jgi:signal transduction histidine kinase
MMPWYWRHDTCMRKAQQADSLAQEYRHTLRRYLERADEAALQHAYELGRRGMAGGRGVLGMIDLHHRTMVEILANCQASEVRGGNVIQRAGTFFRDCMSPFEMTHRAVGDANQALRNMNQSLEDEVKRIAHALHDEAGQLLAAVHLSLDQVTREIYPLAQQQLREVKNLLEEVDHQMRRLSHELRPTILDDLGLAPALEFLSEGVAKRSGLRISVRSSHGRRLPATVETVLYRVVQEALNNIVMHAHATSVVINLRNAPGTAECSVIDDGVGFNLQGLKDRSRERGFGLLGMQEKLQSLGGAVRIESAPGQGTKLFIAVPREV